MSAKTNLEGCSVIPPGSYGAQSDNDFLGATYLGNQRCRFCVWAPLAEKVSVKITTPEERLIWLKRSSRGYHHVVAKDVEPGSLYYYLLDGEKARPDPASRFQPHGVHGPSQVVNTGAYAWSECRWIAPPRRELVIYELHVGTFTPEGTFDAVIPRLNYLRDLGITAVELMPVAQFPGNRNWGYDGVYPFAVQDSYGGPEGLQRLVNACHNHGLAVILDVVYNHLGPEGNYLSDFGPYFTDRYRTPWGLALNFDGPDSDEVRRFFIENALYWVSEFRVDGLRLDAIHAIVDTSAVTFLEDLAEAVHRQAQRLARRIYVIAESDLNNARIIQPRVEGGYDLDAMWSDDFHHSLHALLTGERIGYYQDFGPLRLLDTALRQGYVYTGEYSIYRRRRHGNRPRMCTADQFVVFSQNHDQVGNRAGGERLSVLVSFSDLKLAAGMVLLSPFLPLIFMGEEYGETAPFQYFTSHSDPELIEAVRKGRREEFAAFNWEGEVPDPQDRSTFRSSRLNFELRLHGRHKVLLELYRLLIRLRRQLPALSASDTGNMDVFIREDKHVLSFQRRCADSAAFAVFSFSDAAETVTLPTVPGKWRKLLDTSDRQWLGDGGKVPAFIESSGETTITLSPKIFVLFERLKED
ncbi:MAG: malto-oligosyltrehalose trehalohydrolase [Bacillota bacterium]